MISAFKDSRFPPISPREIEFLTVTISYLKNFDKGKDAFDWEIGKHGITISFKVDDHEFGSTFLPEIALDHFGNKDDTLKALIAKSGILCSFSN